MAPLHKMIMLFVAQILLLVSLVNSIPMPQDLEATTEDAVAAAASSNYWVANIKRQGLVAFGNGTDYKVFRNVQDFGAKGMSISTRRDASITNKN